MADSAVDGGQVNALEGYRTASGTVARGMPVVDGGQVDGEFFGIGVSWHYGSEISGTGVLHGWGPWTLTLGIA